MSVLNVRDDVGVVVRKEGNDSIVCAFEDNKEGEREIRTKETVRALCGLERECELLSEWSIYS